MDKNENSLPGGSIIGKIVFSILSLVALYYLYQFLFSPSGLEGKVVINGINEGNPERAYITPSANLPAIYEGGELSVNGWVYINDYAINRGRNKHVFSLGGTTFLTLAVFLGPYKNSLAIRVHTTTPTTGAAVVAGNSPSADNQASDTLTSTVVQNLFGTLQTESSLLTTSRPCDISSIDLQKWVQITVTLNNKTCDVYLDGKLARSCILPSFYKVDKSNFALNVADYRGFGGFVSNVSAYNYALNPEQVWRLYMSGPGPQYGFLDYITGLFDPKALGSFDFPKKNIVA
jgi:hypothetical protein